MPDGISIGRLPESAEDRYPGIAVWAYHRAFALWFIVGRDDPMKRLLPADCARPFTDFAPPRDKPGGCPDLPTTTTLDLGTLQDFRAKDDRREWLQDPKTWDLAQLARDADPLTGNRNALFESIRKVMLSPEGKLPTLTDLVRPVLQELFGRILTDKLLAAPAEAKRPPATEIPTEPPEPTAADELLDFAEAVYTERTGNRPPPTPQLRHPGSGPGHFKLPGFNPTYPTDRGLRGPTDVRQRFAYLYGLARSLYYECADLTFWQDIRREIPETFRPLYALDLDQAEQQLRDLRARKRARFEERDYDLRTCRPRVAPEEEPPPAPPAAPPAEVFEVQCVCQFLNAFGQWQVAPPALESNEAACRAAGLSWNCYRVYRDPKTGAFIRSEGPV